MATDQGIFWAGACRIRDRLLSECRTHSCARTHTFEEVLLFGNKTVMCLFTLAMAVWLRMLGLSCVSLVTDHMSSLSWWRTLTLTDKAISHMQRARKHTRTERKCTMTLTDAELCLARRGFFLQSS